MKKRLLAIFSLFFVFNLVAGEPSVDLPAGVHDIQYDGGKILSFVVVGKAPASKSMRQNPEMAVQMLSDVARNDAHAEAAKFFSRCTFQQDANGKTSVIAPKSTGDQPANPQAQQFVCGISCVNVGLDQQGNCSWVGKWSMKQFECAQEMRKLFK